MRLQTQRKYKFVEEVSINDNGEKETVSVTFHFSYAEKKDYSVIKEFLQKEEIRKKKKIDIVDDTSTGFQLYYNTLRQSLVECEGFYDQDDNPLIPVKDGIVNEEAQMAVFEWVLTRDELMKKINIAFEGVTNSKNLTTGLQQ